MKKSDSEFILEIFDLNRNDSGLYTVTAHALGGAFNKSFHLQVKDKPIVKIGNITSSCHSPGQFNRFLCKVEAFPLPDVTWSWKPFCHNKTCKQSWISIDDFSILNNDTVWMMSGDEGMSSAMLSTTAKSSGYYKCEGRNEIGISERVMEFIVTDAVDCIDIMVTDKFPLEMTNFSLKCKVSSDLFQDLRLKWKSKMLNQSRIIEREQISFTNTTNSMMLSLNLEFITKNETGEYTCIGILRNRKGKREKSVFINVLEIKEPSFVNTMWNNSKLILAANSYVELECFVEGTPSPKVVWYRNGNIIDKNVTGGKFVDNFQKLVISRLVKEDSGFYECRAKNVAGNVSQNISLTVISEDTGLQISHLTNNAESTRILTFILTAVGVALTIMFFFLLGRWFYHKKYTMKILQGFNHQLFLEGRLSVYDSNVALDDQADLLPYDEKWEFPKENLKLGRTLGQGAFGRVVKAEAFGLNDYEVTTTVAVKMLKQRADLHQQKALIAELKILIHLGHHVNIVNLMGAVTKNIPRGELLVMVEYCRYGNIREYLLRHRDNFVSDVTCLSGESTTESVFQKSQTNNSESSNLTNFKTVGSSQGSTSTGIALDNPNYRERIQSVICSDPKQSTAFTSVGASMSCASDVSVFRPYHRMDSHEHVIYTSDLICYAFQCACGMDYLASKKLIHRDLAARNVLLADDKVVKICDFGLAKDCYNYENYIKKGDGPLPIKWMAIESIRDHIFTTKSDVWSFAILMWEFFALGGNPYPGIEVDEDFYKRLISGYRMKKPDNCPNAIYYIMQDCWHSNPNLRPDFNEIANILGGFLDAGVKQHYKDLNTPYLVMNNQRPDYMNVISTSAEKDVTYVNSNINPELMYDKVPPVKGALGSHVPKEAMEVVPMIQLESIKEDNFENRIPKLETNDSSQNSDYLKMGESREESTI